MSVRRRCRCRDGRASSRVGRGFTLIDLMITMTILAILAAIALPRFSNATDQAQSANVASQLFTIRNQIALYNSRYPTDPFNPLVPGGAAAWDQLLENNYLQSRPVNPLQESWVVMGFPANNVGWVWANPLGTGTTIFAVSANGSYLDDDADGLPD